MKKKNTEIITFKVDEATLDAMKGITNRSKFIRAAVFSALNGVCPLCRGAGVLTPKQIDHWNTFAEDHTLRQCPDCHETHLSCSKTSAQKKSGRSKS